jgi:hypothetical protein
MFLIMAIVWKNRGNNTSWHTILKECPSEKQWYFGVDDRGRDDMTTVENI